MSVLKAELTWVRFSGAAGTRLAPGPMEPFRCGTQGTGWYKGYLYDSDRSNNNRHCLLQLAK